MHTVLFILLLSALTPACWAQTYEFSYTLKGELANRSAKVYHGAFYSPDSEYPADNYRKIILVLEKDTITVAETDTMVEGAIDSMIIDLDTCFISERQSGNGKQKEIILSLHFHSQSYLGEHGDYEWRKKELQIWNRKEKRKVFSATTDYHYKSSYFKLHNDSMSTTTITECSLAYDVRIPKWGELTLQNAWTHSETTVTNDNGESMIFDSDHCRLIHLIPGVYLYKKGKYVWDHVDKHIPH